MTDQSLLSQCAASGQMDSRQIEAHRAAGELPITMAENWRDRVLRRFYAMTEEDEDALVTPDDASRWLQRALVVFALLCLACAVAPSMF